VNGTGKDEADTINYAYKSLALDPALTEPLLVVLVYGDDTSMVRAENRATIDRILRSIRPHR
jgi:hypothetical protein